MAMTDSDPVAFPEDAVEVGRISGAWGVRGWVRVHPFSSDPQALFGTRRWFLKPGERPGGPAAFGQVPPMLHIAEAKEHGEEVVARIRDVDDRSVAESLKGARVFVARTSFPSTPDDEFYWVDLIGCTVVNREGVEFGPVVGLIETGPHCVLRIGERAEQGLQAPPVAVGDEADAASATSAKPAKPAKPSKAADVDAYLIPFVDAYVDSVDLAARRITVDWQADY